MDIWAWVNDLQRDLREAGHERVADLIDSIPEDKHRSRPERVMAALPEAIAAARALKNPWLEVFFRHWGLSNRMNNLAEGDVALSEAASLIEFAHRESNAKCPQAVCATQDLAICYGNIDGPGWADERLAVCDETLARINPSWPCFSCISAEYADALLDAGKAKEAEVFLDQQAAALLNEGDSLTPSYQALQARAVWRAGDAAKALTLLLAIDQQEESTGGDDDPEELRSRAILRANILAEQGDHESAASILPEWSELQPRSYEDWSLATFLVAQHFPERNTWHLGRDLQMSLSHFSRVGAHFDAVTVALRHAELALARGASWTARRALAIAQAHVLKLRAKEVLAPKVSDLAQRLSALPVQVQLPVPAAELVAYLQQQEKGDPERDVEWLLVASQERPDDSDLAEFVAAALSACGTLDEARSHLLRFVHAHPEVNGPIYRLMSILLDANDGASLSALAQSVEAKNSQAALWIRAQMAYRQSRWAEACAHLQAYVEVDPNAVGARHVWAAAALSNNDLDTALRLRKELAAALESPGNEHWDLLTIASACQDWATVREVGAYLGMALEGESGPVEQAWGVVSIRIEHNGNSHDFYARRTGPVTARILAPSYASMPQCLENWVAFDAALLEPAPDDEAERADFIPTFRWVHTIAEGGFGVSCFVDGAAPGMSAFEMFKAAIEQRGWNCWVTSSDDYTVLDPEGDGEAMLPGLHFMVTPPQAVSPLEVDQVLRSLTADWMHPVCWPRYAEHAGLDTSVHSDIVDRYGL